MLFTRCPDCQTTFRVTTEALEKADGQVRCGRCSNIFNAYADLRERTDTPPSEAPPPDASPPPSGLREPDGDAARSADAADAADALPAAEHIVLETAAPAASQPLQAAADSASVIGPDQVQAVLESGAREPVLTTAWSLDVVEEPPRRRTRLWQMGALLALVLLAAQVTHHYRSDLVRNATLGPALRAIYASIGTTVQPRWDVERYELLDWVAAAEPNASGQGNLIITARIRNVGPRPQPYPHVRLRLLDRWEKAVGTRVFRPTEYLISTLQSTSMLDAGDTADAQLVVVDPGPDAYGFELDVCMTSDAGIDCGADDVFR